MFPLRKVVPTMLKSLMGFIMISQVLCASDLKSSASSTTESIHSPPKVTPTFYDPHYHDDGRNHLRGPTAASSSSTMSVVSPYDSVSAASSSYARPSSGGGDEGKHIMAIVDHYYGPNGEEKVQYTNPSQMDKEELEQILSSLKTTSNSPYDPPPPPYPIKPHTYVHPPPPSRGSPSKSTKASSSSHSKSPIPSSSSSPSFASNQGYSLPSLYKSAENSYAPPKPAYSTIYKVPQNPPQKSHYSKGTPEYSPSYDGRPPAKEPIVLHSPKEPSYKSPYYSSSSPESINDALSADPFSKGHPSPYPRGISNGLESNEPPSMYFSSYPPPQPPSPAHYHHHSPPPPPPPSHNEYSPPSKEEYSYEGKGHLKAGFQSLPMKSHGHSHGQSYDYGTMPPPPPPPYGHHHESYSAGFGGGYSSEEQGPYSRHPTKIITKPPYSSSASSPPRGHSLSSLYDPLNFDHIYSRAKPVSGSPYGPPSKPDHPSSSPRPGYGLPPPSTGYHMSYGPPVEYHMPPKGGPIYSTSSSPYDSLGGPYASPPSSKYKGPYRTVNSGPSSYGSHYGYGKPHGLLHGYHLHRYALQRSSNSQNNSDPQDTKKSTSSGASSNAHPSQSFSYGRNPIKYQGDYHHISSY